MTLEKNEKKEQTHNKRKRRRIVFFVLILLVIAELLRANLVIAVDEFEYADPDIPHSFDGSVIVQISDYHNRSKSFCDRLVKKVKEISPDYIFLTGDIADRVRTDIDKANYFLESVSKIAPCYLVWGNHDMALAPEVRQQMSDCCDDCGITVLNDEIAYLEKNGENIAVVGGGHTIEEVFVSEETFSDYPEEGMFTVWLDHYPENARRIVDLSSEKGVNADMIFSGHAHGGLIGLPLLKFGVYAPGQGFFPKYVTGQYTVGDAQLFVSRGVGNSRYTKRFGSSCEIIVCTLKSS